MFLIIIHLLSLLMATKEEFAPAKGTHQDPPPLGPPVTQSYAEWAAAFQAYYGNGASAPNPDYFLAAAPCQWSHTYAWGGQPLVAPYGNATSPIMYSHGGMYAHPTLTAGMLSYGPYAMPSPSTELVIAAPMMEGDVKPSTVNGHGTAKRPKGSKGRSSKITAIGSDEVTRRTSGSETGTEGSSERSEEECTWNGFQTTSKTCFKQSPVNGKDVAGPPTNLKIGMDYWNASTPIRVKGKRASADISTSLMPAPSSSQLMAQDQDGMGSVLWCQKDDKELKRQRRKQSNRDSARRSRLRKQAECAELSKRIDSLTAENVSLRTELNRLAAECKNLFAENAVIMKNIQTYDDKNAEVFQEQDESSEKQSAQPQEAILNQSIKGKESSAGLQVVNDRRMTDPCESAASLLPLRGHSDGIAAG